ncbi:MAG: hypothetical protein DHS20C16_32710 [Phycisphaerae bacterium]|nr:MAG: hypothetical protein DHS20C16_32710 [Phycisphaerae bacterium]
MRTSIRNRSGWLALMLGFVLLTGCDTPPAGNGGNGGGDNGDDICTNGVTTNGLVDTNGICTNGVENEDNGELEPPEPGEDGQFSLTLNMDGLDDIEAMRVIVVADDVLYSRENAPYSDIRFSFNAVSDENPDVFVRNIAEGQQVTLIAIEAKGITSDIPVNDIRFPTPFNFEFVGWSGDVDDQPEDGVATLEMDGDKEVTVMFQAMPVIDVIKIDENNPQLLGGCYDVVIDAPPLLAFPTDLSIDGTREGFCRPRFAGQVKTGTVFTLTAEDSNGCDAVSGLCTEQFDRWEGDPSSCGSNRECMFQVDTATNITAIWRDTTQP